MPDLVQHAFDCVILHLRNAYQKPDTPTWQDHIAPILTQYGNLYPVMNERIVDLTAYESVKNARAILALAFSLDIADPNYMPVTRDLSAAKRETILQWLNERAAQGHYILRYGTATIAPAPPTARSAALAAAQPAVAPETVEELSLEDMGGKADFLRSLPASLRNRRRK